MVQTDGNCGVSHLALLSLYGQHALADELALV